MLGAPHYLQTWASCSGWKQKGRMTWPPGELGPSPHSRCRPESWAKVELWDFWAEIRTIIVASKKIKESHPAKIEVNDWSIFLELYAYRVVRSRCHIVSATIARWEAGHQSWWMFPGVHPSVREEIIALDQPPLLYPLYCSVDFMQFYS